MTALVLFGLLLRVGFVLTLPEAAIDSDEVDYVESAQGLLAGSFEKTVYFHVPPVVPLLYAAVFAVTGPSFLAARLFQCLLFVPIAWVAHGLAREIGGELAALMCLGLCAGYPYFVFFTGHAMTETTATLLVPAVLLLAVRTARVPSLAGAALLGLSLAAATLTRASVLYFVLAVPIAYAIAFGWRDPRWARLSSVVAAAFLAIYLPWCAVNYRYFGEFVPTPTIGSGVMLYQTALRLTMPNDEARLAYLKKEVLPRHYNPPGGTDRDRLAGDRRLAAEGARLIRENLDRYPQVVWVNFTRFWQFYPRFGGEAGAARAAAYKLVGLATYGVLFPFIVLGAVLGLRHFRQLSAAYGFVAYFTLVHVVLFGKLRYRLPLDPLLLAFASLGAAWGMARLRPSWSAALAEAVGAGPTNVGGNPQ